MYTLVRRFIKTGITFLFVGLLLGLHMLVQRELQGRFAGPHLRSAHTHALLVGFVMFLILGVALWLFPRPEKSDSRYDPGRMALVYWLLTISTAARIAAEAVVGYGWPHPILPWVITAGGVGQVVGLALYFWGMWGRIRPVGSHLREARGERF